MIIDLEKLESLRKSFDLQIDSDEFDFEGEEIKPVGEINFKGEVKKGSAQTDITGEISAVVEIDCSRCLQTIESPLEIPVKTGFITIENSSEETEKELDAEDLDVSYLEDTEINLKEIVREQILLAIPSQFLCKEDCKGLCEVCGKNQNLINCNCKENETDPRWSALKDLKFKK